MKNTIKKILLASFGLVWFMVEAQAQPHLSISKISSTSAQVSWTNEIGTSYRLLSTPNLVSPLSSWPPLEDAFSGDTNVIVDISTATANDFFAVMIPTNNGVQIFSPTNNQIVNGAIAVGVGAQIGSQIQGVNLYLDDALIGYINSGGIQFNLDTTHFTNGSHTLYVSAVDTANNETLSDPITLDFENPVRWLDASSIFSSSMPIDVESDIFPADWMVSVTDTNGTIVRTISGSTSDGNIHTSWDGTDNNGNSLPDEKVYQITVDVAESGGSSMMTTLGFATVSGITSVSSSANSHGVLEYTAQKSAPNPMTAYLEMLATYLQLTPQEQLIYPPLPQVPVDNPDATTTVKMSAREMFLASHQSANSTLAATPNAGLASSGSTKTLAWRETSWRSGETILAYAGDLGLIQGSYVSADMESIRELINEVALDLSGNRDTYQNAIYKLSTAADFSTLTNHLAETSPDNVRALYFYGHGNANGNAIGTQTTGIYAKAVAAALGNHYTNDHGQPMALTHHPYSFVFLDGCNTGRGDFPEAFGIPKAAKPSDFVTAGRKRAFMGWGAKVTHSIVGNYPLAWSLKFWQTWLGDGSDSSVALQTAIDAAESYHSGVTNDFKLTIIGNNDLTWGE